MHQGHIERGLILQVNIPVISNPILILAFLSLIVLCVNTFVSRYRENPIIKHLPAPLWCYFLPMIASAAGLIPKSHEIYSLISTHFLPACLILLLASAHLSKVTQLGKAALIAMAAASMGIILGGPLLFLLFKPFLPENAWMGLGTLSGSWTGGSINMIAVKESIGTPESMFSVMVIVDSIMAYVWMGLIIAFSSFQHGFDRWNQSNLKWLDKMGGADFKVDEHGTAGKRNVFFLSGQFLAAALIGFSLGELCVVISKYMTWLPFINSVTWSVLIATAVGIWLSLKKIKKADNPSLEKLGYFLLYLLLTSIGARADLGGIGETPVYLLFGVCWLAFMALVLLITGRIFKIPVFFLATASQANVGGTASATIVAGVYQPHLAFVGLLLAVLGNIFGTYLGIGCSYLMKWIS